MNTIKYILYPGDVRSINDEELHFITYGQLIKLYGLAPSECINGSKVMKQDPRNPLISNHEYIHLYPRTLGDYKEHIKSRLK